MNRPLAAATVALLMVAGGCGAADHSIEVTGMIGAYQDLASGEDLGEVFTDGPCQGWQDWEGNVHVRTWSYGEDAGVSWVSDDRVAGDIELTMDADVQDEGDTCVLYFTGAETITNDNGTWEGTWTFGEGAADDQHFHDVTFTLLGTVGEGRDPSKASVATTDEPAATPPRAAHSPQHAPSVTVHAHRLQAAITPHQSGVQE